MPIVNKKRPTIGLLYLDHVLRFFDNSNFRGWPDKIETVVYHWGDDAPRFINEVKRKKIDVLIGNIPATAYESFRKIARALPEVRFIPDLDAQFANKSKENVTHFCEKYNLPAPKTRIFYEQHEARSFLASTCYPKIIKRSYGPSNYGGYYVHKVDSEAGALELLTQKRYYPVCVQDFIPMKADIRVMLIGHKPVCAFWRRPPKGEWLTNTSQGGSTDYMDVPKEALDLAVRCSKAANADYWACDIAVSFDNQYRILECATAFAAFPYIRDWIGQYLIWQMSSGSIPKPHIPLYNWEELGKISSSVLRTMRYIHFSRASFQHAMTDTGEMFHKMSDDYPVVKIASRFGEEWPSEQWNRQDNYHAQKNLAHKTCHTINKTTLTRVVHKRSTASEYQVQAFDTGIEDPVIVITDVMPPHQDTDPTHAAPPTPSPRILSESELIDVLSSARGVSKQLATSVVTRLGCEAVIEALNTEPDILTQCKNIKARRLAHVQESWDNHKHNDQSPVSRQS